MKFAKFPAIAAAVFMLPAVAFAQTDDSILNNEFIISQEFIEGDVVRVKPIARTITVRGEKRGKTRQFTIPEGTRVTVNGRDATLRDIRKGDSILFAMKPVADDVVVARLRVPKTDRTLEQRRANPIVAAATPAMLPKTASVWPAVLALGIFTLFGAGLLRIRRRYS